MSAKPASRDDRYSLLFKLVLVWLKVSVIKPLHNDGGHYLEPRRGEKKVAQGKAPSDRGPQRIPMRWGGESRGRNPGYKKIISFRSAEGWSEVRSAERLETPGYIVQPNLDKPVAPSVLLT